MPLHFSFQFLLALSVFMFKGLIVFNAASVLGSGTTKSIPGGVQGPSTVMGGGVVLEISGYPRPDTDQMIPFKPKVNCTASFHPVPGGNFFKLLSSVYDECIIVFFKKTFPVESKSRIILFLRICICRNTPTSFIIKTENCS